MNEALATKLNDCQNDNGLLDMAAVTRVLEAHFGINILDALYTGGSAAHNEARDIYRDAQKWNAQIAVKAKDSTPARKWHMPYRLVMLFSLAASAAGVMIVL